MGNLYINRTCTGAVVGAHPFGGFNMSGGLKSGRTGLPVSIQPGEIRRGETLGPRHERPTGERGYNLSRCERTRLCSPVALTLLH